MTESWAGPGNEAKKAVLHFSFDNKNTTHTSRHATVSPLPQLCTNVQVYTKIFSSVSAGIPAALAGKIHWIYKALEERGCGGSIVPTVAFLVSTGKNWPFCCKSKKFSFSCAAVNCT